MGAFNGAGLFVRSYNWSSDAANAIPIMSARMDAEDNGFATGLSNCICKDGQTTITADIPFNSHKITGLGNPVATTDAVNLQTGDARYARLVNTSFSASGNSFSLSASPINVVLNTVDFQNGGTNYNNSTGLFTAPVAGIYLFSAALSLGNGGSSANFSTYAFYKNGVFYSGLSSPSNSLPFSLATGQSVNMNGSIIITLALNDTIGIVASGSTSSSLQAGGLFQGNLLK